MKKTLQFALMVSLALGISTTVLAEGNGKSQVATEKIASSTEKRNLEAQKILQNRYAKMIDRFQATIDREESIQARLVSRMSKIKDLGGNTTAAEKLMDDSKAQLAKAKTALTALKTSIDAEIAAETASTTSKITKDAITGMRKAGADIEKYLREAHKDMQKIIGVLRGVSELHNASSTKEN